MTKDTKSIDTLIEDIYSVFTEGYSKSPANEEMIDAFGEAMKGIDEVSFDTTGEFRWYSSTVSYR